ncbi:MAG: DMT family transporter [Agarilytica sp.]
MSNQNDAHSLRTGLLVLYASILLLALNGFFAKAIPLDATGITQMRSVVACIALFLLLLVQKSSFRLGSVREFIGVYALGVVLAVHWVTYFHAMQVSTVAIGMLALFSYPVITVLIEPIFKGLWPKPVDIFAACVVLFGVFLMVSEDVLAGELDNGAFLGAIWGVISAILFSLRNTTQKYAYPHVNSIALMAHQTLIVAVLLIPFIEFEALKNLNMNAWGMLILLGCLSTAMAHTFLSMSLKRLSAKTVGLISCNTPVFGAAIAWLVLGEVPSTMVYVGGVVILAVAAWETLKGSTQS